MRAGRAQAALLEQPVIADDHRLGVDQSLRAPSGQRLKPFRAAEDHARLGGRARRWRGRSGCSDRDSSDAASRSTSGAGTPSVATTSTTRSRPCVSVPVLSNAMQRTAASCSRRAPPLISTPFRAAAASADTIETGVEITSAHGQEMTSSTSER